MIQSIKRLAKKHDVSFDLPRNLALGVIAGSLLAKTYLEPPSPLLPPQNTMVNFPIMSLTPTHSPGEVANVGEDHLPEHSFYVVEEKNLSAYGTSGSPTGTDAGSTNWIVQVDGENWGFLDSRETPKSWL